MTDDATIVFGLGATGLSCLRHLNGRVPLMAIDTRNSELLHYRCREAFPDVEIITQDDWPRALERARRLVVSPGVPLDDPLVQQASDAGMELSSDIDLFLGEIEVPVIAITGTNGKSTVTVLVHKLLEAAGIRAEAGGNLGPPALDIIDGAVERYVLELSSFQLERLENPGFDIASVLNITPDHLDRYDAFETYAAVKQRIYQGAGRAVYNAGDPNTKPPASLPGIAVADATAGADDAADADAAADGGHDWYHDDDALVLGGDTVIPLGDLKLQGRHNHFNLVAGAAIAHLAGVPASDMGPTLCEYGGLAHRAVSLGTIRGIRFINDSKATNVGAANAALHGLGNGRNIVLIAGGDDKGASFEALRDAAEKHVIAVVLIGRDTRRIGSALAAITSITHAESMSEAVSLAYRAALVGKGDLVLLAPACASFDMFDDFSARGDEFAKSVRELRYLEGAMA